MEHIMIESNSNSSSNTAEQINMVTQLHHTLSKLRELNTTNAEPSLASKISHELSKINYLKAPSATQEIISVSETSILTQDTDNIQHVFYDKANDKFYGTPSFDRNLHWDNVHLAGSWGHHAYEYVPWDDAGRSLVKIADFESLELTPEEKNGILSSRVIAACSSYLERSPETEEYVLCKCVLSRKNLRDISALKYYHYLQCLDISENSIDSLEALGQLPFLMYLDASSNCLTEALDFKAPFNLTFANLSNNNIQRIRDLSDFWSLLVLDLSHNQIEAISGLQNLKYLKGLNLAYNWINRFEGLNNLIRLQCLILCSNVISNFEEGPNVGIKTMINLKKLSISRNLLTSLKIVAEARYLQLLDVCDNRIGHPHELLYLRDLTELSELDMRENPIRFHLRYFDTAISLCKNLFILDGEEVTSETKVLCRKKFNRHDIDYNLSDSQHMLLKNINFPKISKDVVPYTEPPLPMIVLVGPPSSMKGLMVDIICEIFPKYVIRGVNHTTRNRSEGEIDGEQYHFVTYEVFKEMVRKGQFYTTSEYFGNLYGFAVSEVTKLRKKKSVLLLHTDLHGALMLRARGLRPTLVLVIPQSKKVHLKYLNTKYTCHSIHSGIVGVSSSGMKAYEGLTRMKPYSHLHIVNCVKEMLNELHRDVSNETAGGIPISPAASALQLTICHEQIKRSIKMDRLESWHPIGIDNIIMEYVTVNGTDSFDSPNPNEEANSGHRKSSTFSTDDKNFIKTQLIGDILMSRETYLDMHRSNPGFFTQVIHSEYLDRGLDIMEEVLKTCVQTYHLRAPICPMKHNPTSHPLVLKRLQNLRNMLNPEGIVANEKQNCVEGKLGFQNVEGKCYSTEDRLFK